MRTKTLTALTVLAGIAVAAAGLPASAQPAPPPGTPPGSGPADGAAPGPGPHRPWMHHRAGADGSAMGPMRRFPIDPSLFAMMYRPTDRKLTPPDVQKIAEAILLWFGNRTWKVTDVGPDGDGKVRFAYATADGSVIARFTMDTRNGRVVRTG